MCLTILAVMVLLTKPAMGQGTVQVVFTTWEPYGYMDGDRASGFELDIFRAVMDIPGWFDAARCRTVC
jgi:ABC-type amino acid transport substrate-binding protein